MEMAKTAVLVISFSYFFYRSIFAVVPMSLLGAVYFTKRRRQKIRKDQDNLALQFKECILSAAASLRAGYAVENAFLESLPDMRMLYGINGFICKELEIIRSGLVLNMTLEELLRDFGQRSHVEEIVEFAEVFAIAKRSGGNISEVIRHSAEMIGDRIEAKEEIKTALASKQLEQKVMNAMPFGILLYIEMTNKGFFNVLYHNLTGVAVMTSCLLLYLLAYWIAGKIMGGII